MNPPQGGQFYCQVHGQGGHSTSECRAKPFRRDTRYGQRNPPNNNTNRNSNPPQNPSRDPRPSNSGLYYNRTRSPGTSSGNGGNFQNSGFRSQDNQRGRGYSRGQGNTRPRGRGRGQYSRNINNINCQFEDQNDDQYGDQYDDQYHSRGHQDQGQHSDDPSQYSQDVRYQYRSQRPRGQQDRRRHNSNSSQNL